MAGGPTPFKSSGVPAANDSMDERVLSSQECSTSNRGALADVSLYVEWANAGSGGTGGIGSSSLAETKVNRLLLKPIESIDCLQGVSRQLVQRAFSPSEHHPLPRHLTSPDYYRYTPAEEFLSLPFNSPEETVFRLALTSGEGWEYVVSRGRMSAEAQPGQQLLVTVIEFESTAVFFDSLGIRVSLVAFPVIAVSKEFLDDVADQVERNPDFKGIL